MVEELKSHTIKVEKNLSRFFNPLDMICKVKQDVWLKYQSEKMQNAAVTISYDSFKSHPLYTGSDIRSKFDAKQTHVGESKMGRNVNAD